MWVFGDTFDHYATADRFMKWTTEHGVSGSAPTISAGNGRRSTACMRFSGSSVRTQSIVPVTPAPSGATFIAGFAFKHSVLAFSNLEQQVTNDPIGDTQGNGLLFLRANNANQLWVRINSDGTLNVYRGTTLLGTTSSGLSLGSWHHLQIKVVLHASTGTVTIKIDDVSVMSLTGQNTQNAGVSTWGEVAIGKLRHGTTGTLWDFDDLYLCDGSGSYNNDLLGDIRGDVLLSNAVGNSNMSTPSSGGADRYTMVDEASINGDTDYVTLAAVDDKDTYGMGDCPVSGATVYAMQANMGARKADAGAALVKAVARISGTDYDGSDRAVGAGTYRFARQVWDRSPVDGTSALTTATIDAMELGLKKSA